MRCLAVVLFSLLSACATTQQDHEKAAKDFKSVPADLLPLISRAEFETIRLSPDGKYLAATYHRKGGITFAILDRTSMKVTGAVDLDDDFDIGSVLWATPTRVVISVYQSDGYLKKEAISKQRIYAMNVDGTQSMRIYPEGCGIGRECVSWTASDSRFASKRVFEGRYIILEERKAGVVNVRSILRKVDIFTGRTELADNSYVELGSYEVDNSGNPRVKISWNLNSESTIYTRGPNESRWNEMKWAGATKEGITTIGFSKDNRTLYFSGPTINGMAGLYSASFDDKGSLLKVSDMFSDHNSDIQYVYFDQEDLVPYYVDYGLGKPQRKYLIDNQATRDLKELEKSFPGDIVHLVDRRGTEMLLDIESDVRPDTYYIYDSKVQAVRKLLSTNEKIDPATVVPSKHVVIKARDGVDLHAYLYLPKGAKGPVPMIVNIHGGPFGISEEWGFKGENEFFANLGYAVLRVNYRGSGLQGIKFERMGYRNLGTTMQYDIADSIQWAVKQGYAQAGRVCTYGGSYGGYSAVMSAMLFPQQIKCAVGWGGVYDWDSLAGENDARWSERSQNYWKKRLPLTQEERLKQSPISQAAALKANLFIVHGTSDARAPIEQARRLKDRLQSAGKTFQYLEYPDVGHWFDDGPMKSDYYARVAEFLKTQLK